MALIFTVEYCFFPGVMFKYKLSFISSFAWFAIAIITYHNILDTLGRYLGGRFVIIPKHFFYLAALSR